mmetsp:Transcript_17002/g.34417  ORF Transcript_17002/g.34417 Transcript_17002/m.34417 type:complete len:1751 (-) Transcript_17002:590-5842(-)
MLQKWFAQWFAMSGKAVTLRRRRWISTLFELACPVIAMGLITLIHSEVAQNTLGNSYRTSTEISRGRDSIDTCAWCGRNTQNYLSWCEKNGYKFFVTRAGSASSASAQDLAQALLDQNTVISSDTISTFGSEGDLESYVRSTDYANNPYVCGAVVLTETGGGSGNKWNYKIRMNASNSFQEDYPKQVPSTRQVTNELSLDGYGESDRYLYLGFLAIQNFVDAWIINQTLTTQTYLPPTHRLQFFPQPEFQSDIFTNIVAAVLGLFLTLAFIWPLQRIVKSLVEEKETRIKELMFQMSLLPTAWFVAWLTLYIFIFGLAALFIILITGSNVYANSEKGIIFAFYFLFGMCVFAFAFMMSSVFSKANTAATMATVFWLGSFFGYYAISSTTSTSALTFACISAPVCVGIGSVLISTLESNGIGVTSENLNTEISFNGTPTISGLDIGTVLGMLTADFFIYTIIGLYLEQVWPGEYGVAKAPWFFLMPSYWCPNRHNTAKSEPRKFPAVYEPDPTKALPPGLEEGLAVTNLRKEFPSDHGSFVAVDGLCVDMFRNQVFALLGHNGAGKTTTINMLTGMYNMTSGDAVLHTRDGKDLTVSRDLDAIQEVLGVCPQHDVLFPDLTVSEHLRIMARTKGVPGSEIKKAVDDMIELVGLTEKIHVQTHALSGGQKRKLSISMALIGNSDLVFLDEPTSGVDPYSRRSMWEVIRRAKQGRVVVLTTHFMDEADTLGDRIGIMEHGKLACCGSSLHLKNVYGVGYTFTISLLPKGDAKAVRKVVQTHVPDVKSKTTAGEVHCRLPLKSAKHFPAMMEELDENMKELGVASYGISVTTLEEVFLKVGSATKEILDEQGELGAEVKGELKEAGTEVEMKELLNNPVTEAAMLDAGKTTASKKAMEAEDLAMLNSVEMKESGLGRQLYSLLLKRWWNYRRDQKGWAWTILYPLAILLLGLGLMQLGIEQDFPELEMTPSMFNTPNYVTVDKNAYSSLLSQQDGSNVVLLNATVGNSCPDGLDGSVFPIPFENVTAPTAARNLQYVLSCTWSDQFKESKYLAFVAFDTNRTFSGQGYGLVDTYLTDNAPGNVQQQFFDTNENQNFTHDRSPFVIYYNETGFHSPAVGMNMANTAMARNYTGDANFEIKVVNDPLPLTDNEKELSPTIVALLTSLAFSMIPAFFVFFVVTERIIGAKHQQIISGVDLFAYWFSTWIWDVVSGLIPGLLTMAVFAGFGLDALVGENSGAMILNIILYVISISAFTYVFSFCFSNANTAQNVMLLIYFTTGAMLAIASDVLDNIGSTADINKQLKYMYRLTPSFCFAECVINLLRRERNGRSLDIWDMDVTGYPMLFMAWEAAFYFMLVLFIEFILLNPGYFTWLIPTPRANEEEFEEDVDITAERKRVDQMISSGTPDMVSLQGLRKVYGGGGNAKVAVQGMYFGVPLGQCFGFLGINGAGKTTTLKMLTGAVYPSKGDGFLNGLSVLSDQRKIRKYLGYCPQFDAFLGTLTARETLLMFGHIKGIPSDKLPEYVEGVIQLLGLGEYADRASGGYSGGNKRKLSVGIALLGNPPMVFLDEPSTGMDPASRRTMWNLIQKTMQKRAVILTTHSMEECEALCQRIGIMVGGRMRCLGSEQHLRHRYGDGYQVDIRLKDLEEIKKNEESVRALKSWMMKDFKGAEVVEDQTLSLKFRLPKNLGMSLGKAFALIESKTESLNITEYSLSEMSLEQIFIFFAKQQREETGEVAGFNGESVAVPILEQKAA